MKILIDIGHPAHVHLFRILAESLKNKGWNVLFTVREKDNNTVLLKSLGYDYIIYGRTNKSLLKKTFSFFIKEWRLFGIVKQYKPKITISHGSFYLSQVSWLLGIPNVTLEDTGNMEQVSLYLPFTRVVLTSNTYHRDHGKKQIRYNGYHETAYLHTKRFNIDSTIPGKLGLKEGEQFIILRFVSWSASHDTRQDGLTIEEKRNLVTKLSVYARVIISSEGILPDEFEKFRYPLKPEEMHQCIANASLFIGEGATMASECAMLGVPSIYINSMEAGTINEQEKHGLVYHFRNGKGVLDKAISLLNYPTASEKLKENHKEFISKQIDVTAFLVWFVENWPESFKIMKENPDYQLRFNG